jgi:hypothetical protein
MLLLQLSNGWYAVAKTVKKILKRTFWTAAALMVVIRHSSGADDAAAGDRCGPARHESAAREITALLRGLLRLPFRETKWP